MSLAARSRALLKKIMYAQTPLRIKDLSDEFQVSERTIKYDLETIRFWLKSYQIEIQSKPHKGIWIDCDDSTRIKLLEKSEEAEEHAFSNQVERVRRLMLDLLLLDVPVSIVELSRQNDVTRNTILSDLLIAEQLFADWSLVLERSRLGVQIRVSEQERRIVLEHVVQDLLDSSDMFQIVQGIVQEEKPPVPFSSLLKRFLDPVADQGAMFQILGRLVKETEKHVNVLLSDRVMIGVFVRLCILYNRNKLESAFSPKTSDASLSGKNLEIFRVFRSVLAGLETRWGFPFSDEDIWFVSLQAVGMISPVPEGGVYAEKVLPDVYNVTKKMIREVALGMQKNFQDDHDLFNNLFAHLSDKLTKYIYSVVEPNPLLHEIVRSYKSMFDVVKLACASVFGEYYITLSDADIAFIVLHFQTAYERMDEMNKFRALVVCGTGRGTSRLVKTVVENEFKNVHVAAYSSVMEYEKAIRTGSFDFVISTFPVAANIPVVVVSPIPGKPDFQAIQSKLESIGRAQPAAPDPLPSSVNTEPVRDTAYREQHFQDIVLRGYELSKMLISRFGGQISEVRAEGLTLHILFLLNRISLGSQFMMDETTAECRESDSIMRKELVAMFQFKQIVLTESELKAILRYFECT